VARQRDRTVCIALTCGCHHSLEGFLQGLRACCCHGWPGGVSLFFGPQGSSNGAVSDTREIGLGSSDLRYSDALLKAHACVTRIMPAHGRALSPHGSWKWYLQMGFSTSECHWLDSESQPVSGARSGFWRWHCHLHTGRPCLSGQVSLPGPGESAARRRAASANGSIRAPRILLGHGSLGQARGTQDQQTALAC
jgi:hypothetical protein